MKLTPMMQQYLDIKNSYKDSILFFRLGDFYEMFFEDAVIASRELEITLTQRDTGGHKAPMCGVPHHVADNYISKLVNKGYKVAICEQVEDPKLAKGIVKREVIKVVTPGTITDTLILDDKKNNYLCSIYLKNNYLGIAYGDYSTGEVYTTEKKGELSELLNFSLNELSKINPSELIVNDEYNSHIEIMNIIKTNFNPYINVNNADFNILDFSQYDKKYNSLSGINEVENKFYSKISLYILLDYFKYTQRSSLENIIKINYYYPEKYMILDYNTRSNLEIHETIIGRSKKGALIDYLDHTETAMGGRLLSKWVEQPLIDYLDINKRLDIVEFLSNNIILNDDLKLLLKKIYDLERLAGKIGSGTVNARELNSLKNSIANLPKLYNMLISTEDCISEIVRDFDLLEDIYNKIDQALVEEPPISITEGNLIKENYSSKLDQLKNISKNGKEWLREYESKERELTGIKNLKVSYNRVSGYFLEVTKSNLHLVPNNYIRRQTLANSERYYTEELKSMEDDILNAQDKILELEYNLFTSLREELKSSTKRIQETAYLLAKIDVLSSFAFSSNKYNLVRPNINNDGIINIKDGRHPVVENNMKSGLFVSNDSYLDLDKEMIQLITGPNMSGKSTYMRQIAIITLMAHLGSFVPARQADIPITDRIFTRIGAADNLSQGQSTFMVEMTEVANIIESATKDSLIILDEVGRGTSTYDGLSIAWALIEYIAKTIKAKTLFATHYHELVMLEKEFNNIKNLTILVKEENDTIVFLRKIIKGSTDKSYGIEVAKLAGIKNDIIDRANEILFNIEANHSLDINPPTQKSKLDKENITLCDFKGQYLLEELSTIDVNKLTPLEALNKLNEMVEKSQKLTEV